MLLSECGIACDEALEMGIFPTRILLAIDDSEEAELAATKAVDLAHSTDSELHVVHVGLAPNFLVEGSPGYSRKLYEEIEQESQELLRKLTWRVKTTGGNVAGSYLRMGDVVLEIVSLAGEREVDLIVMGCRDRSRIRRAIAGSVSDA